MHPKQLVGLPGRAGGICRVWSACSIQLSTQAVMTPGTMTRRPVKSHLRKAAMQVLSSKRKKCRWHFQR